MAQDDRVIRLVPKLAKAIGLNESIVLLQIQYWISHSDNRKEGQKWTYQTNAKMREEAFSFLSEGALNRAISGLQKLGALVIANHNARKSDRTRWFAINHEIADKLPGFIISQNGEALAKMANPSFTNGESISQNGETLPEDIPEITHKRREEGADSTKVAPTDETSIYSHPSVALYLKYLKLSKESQPKNFDLQGCWPTIHDAGEIQATVRFIELFERILKLWLTNRYRMYRLGTVLNKYREDEPQWIKEHPPKLQFSQRPTDTVDQFGKPLPRPPARIVSERVN